MEPSAPLADQIRTALVSNPDGIRVIFIKRDGNKRRMHCTTNPSVLERVGAIQPTVIPNTHVAEERTTPTDVLRVWDLEKSGWRSFNVNTVIEFSH